MNIYNNFQPFRSRVSLERGSSCGRVTVVVLRARRLPLDRVILLCVPPGRCTSIICILCACCSSRNQIGQTESDASETRSTAEQECVFAQLEVRVVA